MPLSLTYTTLKNNIISYVEDSSTDFATAVDVIIPIAEGRLMRELDLNAYRKTATSSTTSGDPFITKPTDAIVVRWLNIVQSGDVTPLPEKSVSYLQNYWPDRTNDTGIPRYWAHWDADTILLAPTPNATISLEMAYTKRIALTLSGSNTTYLTTNCADALLYACLLESVAFKIIPQDKVAMWNEMYNRAVQGIKLEEHIRNRGSEFRRGEIREGQ